MIIQERKKVTGWCKMVLHINKPIHQKLFSTRIDAHFTDGDPDKWLHLAKEWIATLHHYSDVRLFSQLMWTHMRTRAHTHTQSWKHGLVCLINS